MKDEKKRKALQIKITFNNLLPVCLFSSNPLLWIISLCELQVCTAFIPICSISGWRAPPLVRSLHWQLHTIWLWLLLIIFTSWDKHKTRIWKDLGYNLTKLLLKKIIVLWYSLQIPKSRFFLFDKCFAQINFI